MTPDSTAALEREVERWGAEIQRLREMIESLRRQQNNLIWFVKLGPVVALPTYFFAWWAPLVVIALALTTYGTGHYFSWGHLVDRRAQLRWANQQHAAARKKLAEATGMPAPDAKPVAEAPKLVDAPAAEPALLTA